MGQEYHAENYGYESRTLFLNQELDSETMCELVEQIIYFNMVDNENEALIKDYTREPITLVISTPGGSAYECMSLIDVITTSKTPVYTVALKGFSAGFLIFLSGHKRFMYQNSTLMYHQIQVKTGYGDLQDHKEAISESVRVYNVIEDFVLKQTDIKKEKLEEINRSKYEWYITSQEALELGITDEIIV